MSILTHHASHSKGQATGFIILGIVVLAIVLLILYLRGQLSLGPLTPPKFGDESLADHIQGCIAEVSPDFFTRIGLQGGHLSTPEGTFRLQKDISVSYLCYNIPGKPQCANRLLTLHDMETELAAAIDQALNTCIRYDKFRKRGAQLTIGQRSVTVIIGIDESIVTVTQPITITRGDKVTSEDTFSHTFSIPLGRLYDVSQDILDLETSIGEFEQLTYMLAYKGEYIIDKKKPYPDKLYILQTKDSNYLFQFFIQGEPLY